MLKQLREEKNMTQVSVAKKLNIATCMLSMYENGSRKLPINLIRPLAKIYEVSTDTIIEYSTVHSAKKNYANKK